MSGTLKAASVCLFIAAGAMAALGILVVGLDLYLIEDVRRLGDVALALIGLGIVAVGILLGWLTLMIRKGRNWAVIAVILASVVLIPLSPLGLYFGPFVVVVDIALVTALVLLWFHRRADTSPPIEDAHRSDPRAR